MRGWGLLGKMHKRRKWFTGNRISHKRKKQVNFIALKIITTLTQNLCQNQENLSTLYSIRWSYFCDVIEGSPIKTINNLKLQTVDCGKRDRGRWGKKKKERGMGEEGERERNKCKSLNVMARLDFSVTIPRIQNYNLEGEKQIQRHSSKSRILRQTIFMKQNWIKNLVENASKHLRQAMNDFQSDRKIINSVFCVLVFESLWQMSFRGRSFCGFNIQTLTWPEMQL